MLKKQNETKQSNNEKKNKNGVHSEIRNIEKKIKNKKKQSKQEFLVSILCFYFFGTPVQIQCPSQFVNQSLFSYKFLFQNINQYLLCLEVRCE